MGRKRMHRTVYGIVGAVLTALVAAPAASAAVSNPSGCLSGSKTGTNGASFTDGVAFAATSVQAPSCVGVSYELEFDIPAGAPSAQSFTGWPESPSDLILAQGLDANGTAHPATPTVAVTNNGATLTFSFNGDATDVTFEVSFRPDFTEPTSFAGFTAVSGSGNSATYCPTGAPLGKAGAPGKAGASSGGIGGAAGAGGAPGCGSNGGAGGNGGNGAVGASGGAGGSGGQGGCQPATPGELLSKVPPCNGTGSSGGAGGAGGNAATNGSGGSGGAGGAGGWATNVAGGKGGRGQNGRTGVAGDAGTPGTNGKPLAPTLDANATGYALNVHAIISAAGQTQAEGNYSGNPVTDTASLSGSGGGGFW